MAMLINQLENPDRVITREVRALVAANPDLRSHREDLEQVTRTALVRAGDSWDPARGASAKTYATTLIRNALTDWLRSRQGRDTLGRDPFTDKHLKVTVPWTGQAIKLPRHSTSGALLHGNRYLTTDNGQLEAAPFAGSSGASGPTDDYIKEYLEQQAKEPPAELWRDGFPIALAEFDVCPGPGRDGQGCDKDLRDRQVNSCGSDRCRQAIQMARKKGKTWDEFLKPRCMARTQFLARAERKQDQAARLAAKVA